MAYAGANGAKSASDALTAAGAAGSRGSARLVRALALLWLVFLVYPLVTVIGALRQPADVGRWLPPVVGLTLAGVIYVWAVVRVTAPSKRSVLWTALAGLSALSLVLPLVFGAAWFGGFLYPCLLAGLTLPPRRMAGAVVIFGALTVVVGGAVGVVWWETVALTLLTGLGGAVMFGITWLLAANTELRAARTEIARLAAEEERLRLSRDLHDSVKQQVFVTAMEIGAARALVERDAGAAAAHLAEAGTSIRQAQAELTAMIHHARTEPVAGESLAAALRAYVGDWSRRSGIPVEARITEEGEPEEAGVREALYRVAQEALANVARHSQATAAGVDLEAKGDAVTLCVWDNGRGFVPREPAGAAAGSGYGLSSMRERMEALGGHVAVESAPGQGTRVRCVYKQSGVHETAGADEGHRSNRRGYGGYGGYGGYAE